jgi:hypothetical protein
MEARINYINHSAFGSSDMDFVKIASSIPALTLNHLAWFTIFLCIFITALSGFLAYLADKENKFLQMPEPFVKTGEVIKKEDEKTDFTNF